MLPRLPLCLALLGATFCSAQENLLQNGGFEDGLPPWQASFGAKACVRVVDTEAHSGKRCAQITCKEQNSGVDFPRLRVGQQIQRGATYRLRAAMRNGGIGAGDFGLRLYFYSSMGEYLAMYTGIGVRGDTPGGWQVGEIDFGRGTKSPIPPAAATMMVRFSMWAPDTGATGTVRLDDVSLEQTSQDSRIRRGRPIAWIWQEPGEKPFANALPDLLAKGGFSVQPKTAAGLCAAEALRTENLDLLVLPQGGQYPVALTTTLPAFFRDGGALLTCGSPPFSEPVYPTAIGPQELTSGHERLPQTAINDTWSEGQGGPDDQLAVTPIPGGRSFTGSLKSYAYAGTTLTPLPIDSAVLELQAKGDANTSRLCIEIHEQDGSRWKAILPLTEEWTTHRLHLATFAAYASKDRGGQGDFLHGRNLAKFLVGYTRNMVGEGPHAFELRDLQFLEADVPAGTVVEHKRFVRGDLSVTRWYGEQHTVEPMVVPAPPVAVGMARQQTVLRSADGTATARGHWRTWDVKAVAAPPARNKGKKLSLDRALALRAGSLRIPLLYAGDQSACAGLFVHADGEFAGSRWAVFALDGPPPLPPVAESAIVDAACSLATAAFTRGPQPLFRVADGKVVMDVKLGVANPSPTDFRVKLALRVGGKTPTTHEITVPARHAVLTEHALATGLPAPQLETAGLDLAIEVLESSGPIYGPRDFQVDLRGQLRAVCDFMVEQARDDGKLHGYSFIDNRGMRALLGAYEILGDPRYRETALRWGELMVQEQREDGGYRMGYGITRKGEECYVADGGEIVVGILRLASYATGEQRQRFLDSADRYMAYRESFRVETGGIGVGWCLQDYGKRPIERLDTPTRIYAPEQNTYTIGCSLAGAYAHATIHHSQELEKRAEMDADWLMQRATRLNGAFIESYIFAHAFATTAERKKLYADYIDRVFTQAMASSYTTFDWWLSGGGRSALNLDGLAYAIHRLQAGPEIRAETYRALCAMYSPQAPRSIPVVIAGDDFDHDRWIYVNFGTLGLVDVLKPMVSIERFR